jgi:peptidoglycan/LPS O-acetylase OafA/YrhL
MGRPPPHHFPWIDWVRFLAAFVVLASHVRPRFFVMYSGLTPAEQNPFTAVFFALTTLGHEAVLVFFVLSGYLVAGRAVERMLASDFRVLDYTIDRFSRIYLPYLPALVLTWACAREFGLRPSTESFLINAACLQGVFGDVYVLNYPLWSIAYEVWFYVLVGFVGAFARFRGPGRVAAAVGILTCLGIFTVLSALYLFCWLLGCLAYFVKSRDRRVIAVAAVAVVYVVAGHRLRTGPAAWAFPTWEVMQLVLAGAVAALIANGVTYRPSSTFLKRIDRAGTRLASFS